MLETEDVLFADLRATRKSLDRTLALGLLLVAIGHVYVVEPYFHYKAQERQVQHTLKDKEARKQQLAAHLDRIQAAKKRVDATLTMVEREIEGYPDHLARTIPRLGRVLASGSSSMAAQRRAPARSIDGFTIPSGITRVEEAVPWYIKEWFGRLLATLRDGVVAPIHDLEELELVTTELDIEAASEEAVGRVRTYVDNVDPGFWRSYEHGKVPVSLELKEVVSASFDPVQAEVSKLLRDVGASVKQQEEDLKAILQALEDSRKQQESLAELVTSLESPFGRIPVGLTAIIKLFPLLVAAMVGVATVTLRRSARLYLALWDEMRKKRPNLDVPAFQRLTDCWYLPPYGTAAAPAAFVLFYLGALAVFARAAWLVMGEPGLFLEAAGTQAASKGFLTGAYLAAVLVLAACPWLAWQTLRSRDMKAIAP